MTIETLLQDQLFSQHPYRCRLEWGRRGAQAAADRGDVLVVVDVLSFSSTVITAAQHGVTIYPCAEDEDPAALAGRVGATQAVKRGAAGLFSLSPLAYLGAPAGARVVLCSPNGATCSRYGRAVPALFIGGLLNATAAAAAASAAAAQGVGITVLACGERWGPPHADGALRVAIEDYLGAGAILAALDGDRSPEAQVCAGAFLQARDAIESLLWECGSGRELRARGFDEDVRHAARLDLYAAVPVLRGEALEPLARATWLEDKNSW